MRFTYQAYADLLALLKENAYQVCSYHDYGTSPRCVILRHDIDTSLEQAVRLARLEAENGVKTTYFVLLRTDFYNVASKGSYDLLHQILSLGHEIGLHFDEAAYGEKMTGEQMRHSIQKERGILAALLDTDISTVSMHRPSRQTLEADLQIPGLVNSYGQTFFHDFKYLSDSRRRWREPVLEIIRGGAYDRLHILTHAFWYHEEEESLAGSVGGFIRAANRERYRQMAENLTDLAAILPEREI